MRVRVLSTLMAVFAVVGCGPTVPTGDKPSTPTGEPVSKADSLDGVWMATKVEVPSGPSPDAATLDSIAATVSGKRVLIRQKGVSPEHLVFEVDEKANPKTVTFTHTDETGDTGPVKRTTPVTMVKGGPVPPPAPERLEERRKFKGIYTLDGDTLKVAVANPVYEHSTGKSRDMPAPTEYKPSESEQGQVLVFHLTRRKELPEWATKPPPAPPTTFSTGLRPTGK